MHYRESAFASSDADADARELDLKIIKRNGAPGRIRTDTADPFRGPASARWATGASLIITRFPIYISSADFFDEATKHGTFPH